MSENEVDYQAAKIKLMKSIEKFASPYELLLKSQYDEVMNIGGSDIKNVDVKDKLLQKTNDSVRVYFEEGKKVLKSIFDCQILFKLILADYKLDFVVYTLSKYERWTRSFYSTFRIIFLTVIYFSLNKRNMIENSNYFKPMEIDFETFKKYFGVIFPSENDARKFRQLLFTVKVINIVVAKLKVADIMPQSFFEIGSCIKLFQRIGNLVAVDLSSYYSEQIIVRYPLEKCNEEDKLHKFVTELELACPYIVIDKESDQEVLGRISAIHVVGNLFSMFELKAAELKYEKFKLNDDFNEYTFQLASNILCYYYEDVNDSARNLDVLLKRNHWNKCSSFKNMQLVIEETDDTIMNEANDIILYNDVVGLENLLKKEKEDELQVLTLVSKLASLYGCTLILNFICSSRSTKTDLLFGDDKSLFIEMLCLILRGQHADCLYFLLSYRSKVVESRKDLISFEFEWKDKNAEESKMLKKFQWKDMIEFIIINELFQPKSSNNFYLYTKVQFNSLDLFFVRKISAIFAAISPIDLSDFFGNEVKRIMRSFWEMLPWRLGYTILADNIFFYQMVDSLHLLNFFYSPLKVLNELLNPIVEESVRQFTYSVVKKDIDLVKSEKFDIMSKFLLQNIRTIHVNKVSDDTNKTKTSQPMKLSADAINEENTTEEIKTNVKINANTVSDEEKKITEEFNEKQRSLSVLKVESRNSLLHYFFFHRLANPHKGNILRDLILLIRIVDKIANVRTIEKIEFMKISANFQDRKSVV